MAEKYITHLEGIPKDKFTISDDGIIINKYSSREVHPAIYGGSLGYSININHYEKRKRTMYNLNVVDLVFMYYGNSHGFDIKNPYLWIYIKDGCCENMSINNLELCLNKTNIPVMDVYKIYDYIIETGSHDNINISKKLGYYIPDKVIKRLMYLGTDKRGKSYELSKLFGYDLKEMRKKCLVKSMGCEQLNTLTNDDVHLICKTIVENGPDVDYVYDVLKDEIPNLVRGKIFRIINKKLFTDISDKYFMSALTLVRGENDPPLKKYPDLPNEIWKSIEDYPEYYVSNKGRVRNKFGRVLKCFVNGTSNIAVSLSGDTKSLSRLVISTFGLDLPKILNMDPSRFEVDHIDNDPTNNIPENLIWIPRGARIKNGGYSISDVNEILNILNETKDKKLIKERIINEICNTASISTLNEIIRGGRYSYFLHTRDNSVWRPIVLRVSNTNTSVVSDKYEISDAGKVREIDSKKYLHIYQEPLRELNLVDINNSPRRIDKMVYDTFIGFNPDHYRHNRKIIHINNDTLDDTPTNLKYIESRKYTDYQTTYEKLYHKYGKNETWKKYMLDNDIFIKVSNFGRIRYNGHFIKPTQYDSRTIDHEKFMGFTICTKSKAPNKTYILRNIVYQAFVGEIGYKQRIYSKDNDYSNCHVCNLELDYVRNDKRSSRYKYHGRRVIKTDTVSGTSVIYDSVEFAANDLNISEKCLRQRINRKIMIDGMKWEYV